MLKENVAQATWPNIENVQSKPKAAPALAPDPYVPTYLIDNGIPVESASADEDEQPAYLRMPLPGITGDIAEFIFENAFKRNGEVAIAGALALMAGICGRNYNWNGQGLNQYFFLLGLSGQGKEDAEKGINRLLSSLADSNGIAPQQLERVLGPSQLVSAAGLINALRDNPCFVSIVPEAGKFLQKLLSKYSRANEALLTGLLLDLFSRSGNGNVLGTSAYSDRSKNGVLIQSPCLTILGVSTQQEFYRALNEDNIGEGLVARLTVIECSSAEYVPSNHAPKKEPTKSLTESLATMIATASRHNATNTVTHVAMTTDVDARFRAIDEKYGRLAYNNREKPHMLAYNRVALITMKTAALLAVGVNPHAPCITSSEFDWAEQFANTSAQTLIKRFEAGKVGEANPYVEQHDQLMNCLKRYLTKEWNLRFEKNYGIPKQFKDRRLVTYKYLKTMLHKQPAFRNAHNPKMALDNIIQTFEKAEHIFKVARHDKAVRGNSVAEMWVILNLRE